MELHYFVSLRWNREGARAVELYLAVNISIFLILQLILGFGSAVAAVLGVSRLLFSEVNLLETWMVSEVPEIGDRVSRASAAHIRSADPLQARAENPDFILFFLQDGARDPAGPDHCFLLPLKFSVLALMLIDHIISTFLHFFILLPVSVYCRLNGFSLTLWCETVFIRLLSKLYVQCPRLCFLCCTYYVLFVW